MVIDRLERAPLLGVDVNLQGMMYDEHGVVRPGKILALWAAVRKDVGIVEAKRKQGMKFDTRAATDLYDKIRAACDTHGVLVYPHHGNSKGMVIEDGTLADVELYVIAQAIEDGSIIQIYGYGQGADSQDKAGGKAGTYAFKQALIQACLAGGSKTPKKDRIPDTDDTDTAIDGGVRAKTSKPKAPAFEEVKDLFEAAQDEPAYRDALAKLKLASPDSQVKLKDIAFAARKRCIPDPPSA